MIAAQGLHWLDREPPGPRWPSFGVAAAITAALFVLAFVSMRSVAPWSHRDRDSAPVAVVVPLRPPPAVTPKEIPVAPSPTQRVVPRPIEQTPAIAPAAPMPAPTLIAPTVTPLAPTIAIPAAPGAPMDTSRPRDVAPQIPTIPTVRHNTGLPDTAMAIRGGAPYAPAGVTIASRTKNTAKLRDSIITEKLDLVPLLARTTPMSAEASAVISGSQAQTRAVSQRATSVGMTRDLYIPMGSGVGGVGAVNGGKTGVTMDSRGIGVTVPFPLFSPGPSPAERKRNEKLFAEYLAYLRRQGDLILFKRDSIRADSLLRLDSLARRRR